jgi:hypothetical protein
MVNGFHAAPGTLHTVPVPVSPGPDAAAVVRVLGATVLYTTTAAVVAAADSFDRKHPRLGALNDPVQLCDVPRKHLELQCQVCQIQEQRGDVLAPGQLRVRHKYGHAAWGSFQASALMARHVWSSDG